MRQVRLIFSMLLFIGILFGTINMVVACADCTLDKGESLGEGYVGENKVILGEEYAGENKISLWLAGLVGSIIFSIKIGSGNGFASLNKSEILGIAGVYSFIVAVIGYIFGSGLNLSLILRLVKILPLFYAIMALCLLLLGIYTVKKWQKGTDVSRQSFWVLVVPCPLLVVSVMLATGLLSEIFQLSSLRIGILIGSVFFVVIVATSFYLRRWKDAPLILGKLMTAAGLSLLVAVLLLPTYFANGLYVSTSFEEIMPVKDFLIPIVFYATFIFLGFIKGRYAKWEA